MDLDLEGTRRIVGTLAWGLSNRTAFFQYDPGFLAAPLPLSPFRLPVDARLLRTGKDAYFAVRRFDRSMAGRHHVHTAAGLVDADFRVPGAIDYEALLRITWALTKNAVHVEQMFRRMVFNVLAHNRDDHAKNHAFLMNSAGEWCPTPAYDLTFSNGPAGEHNLAVAGEGRNPGGAHMLQASRETGIGAARASAIVEDVQGAIARWPSFADEAGLSRRRSDEINGVLNWRKPAL